MVVVSASNPGSPRQLPPAGRQGGLSDLMGAKRNSQGIEIKPRVQKRPTRVCGDASLGGARALAGEVRIPPARLAGRPTRLTLARCAERAGPRGAPFRPAPAARSVDAPKRAANLEQHDRPAPTAIHQSL